VDGVDLGRHRVEVLELVPWQDRAAEEDVLVCVAPPEL
jgi:hypothetical protein